MSAQVIYTGPGKVFFDSVTLDADQPNGQINMVKEEASVDRGSAMFGHLYKTWKDTIVRVTCNPFDNWSLLSTLYPAYIGVTTVATGSQVAGGTGAVAPGTRPHDIFGGGANGLAGLKVWTRDDRTYNPLRGATTKHPNMKFGAGVPLYGPCEITCLGDPAKNPGSDAFLFAGTVAGSITESAGSDPSATAATLADVPVGKWTGAYGSVTGFTGMEAEDAWELVSDVKYNTHTVQGLSRHMTLSSAAFMLKSRLVGPTHTQVMGLLEAHTLGQALKHGSATDMVITNGTKTVTLKNCEPVGVGFEFGGQKLGTGETGWVTQAVFTSGVISPFVIFSA